jgi:hypothetical protein
MEKETNQIKINTPVAIIIAGFLIMVGIILSGGVKVEKDGSGNSTISEQLKISKEKIIECLSEIDSEEFYNKSIASVSSATSLENLGTPYIVIVADNGLKEEVRGAQTYEYFKKSVQNLSSGSVTIPYEGNIILSEESDHVYGNKNAPIKIIEYSDYECSYCKKVYSVIKQIVDESNGQVSWIFRHLPILGQSSFEKAIVGECVAKLKGDDAFWKYSEIIYGKLETGTTPSFKDSL